MYGNSMEYTIVVSFAFDNKAQQNKECSRITSSDPQEGNCR